MHLGACLEGLILPNRDIQKKPGTHLGYRFQAQYTNKLQPMECTIIIADSPRDHNLHDVLGFGEHSIFGPACFV